MTSIPSSVLGPLVYPPQTHGPKSNKTHETLRDSSPEKSALDSWPPVDSKNVIYEMNTVPTHHSGRTRRPSAITRTSSATNVGGEENPKVSTPPDTNSLARVSGTSLPVLPFGSANPSVSKLAEKQCRRNSIIQFIALCWCIYVEGWNDGSTGPLLPVFQRDYHIGFSIVSLYFVSNCAGFMIAAAVNVWLNDRVGLGKIMVLGAVCQLAAYIMQAPGPPFAVMVIANAFAGFGMSLQNAQANGYIGSLKKNMRTKIGIFHATYGLGAFTSPFAATYFSGTKHWSFHYLISAIMAVSNTLALILVFRLKPMDQLLAEAGQDPDEANTSKDNNFRQIFGLKAVHLLAAFSLIYIGIEVTLGGWIVTFVIHERGGGHSAGYISSGFFGGLTLGRIGLMWFNKLVGEHRVIFIYSLITIGLEITIWFVPSIIENAVAVSFIGLVLGPMYPILVSQASRVLPRRLLTVCLGWITGIGIAGSAALPFLTGLLSSRFGIRALQPLLVTMMCAMLIIWAFVPKSIRRVD
ncbi:major facilitator superfamily domain-containing protein [Collybia nuda]|uniref:Major facilitator superfamily domain-containing protein n=2 Tax=Collybia nuda TaxID=64659 RepID=A0A9P5XTB0_9AGAR|nr:major facilitator superfamily domain-containing protein [Collybia nuda]